MAIRLLHFAGRYSPVIVCDHCGRYIGEAAEGLEFSPVMRDLKDGDLTNVFHVHKGECESALQAKVGAAGIFELSDHLHQLVYNSGVNLDEMRRMYGEWDLVAKR